MLRIYASGSSRPAEIEGLTKARHPIGAVALELRPGHRPGHITRAMRMLAAAAATGVDVFVDSGAFGAFRSKQPLDMVAVLSVYRDLVDQVPLERRAHVALVMPDVVGDQAATLALQREHLATIRSFARDGVEVFVPVQRGELSPAMAWRAILGEIGPAGTLVPSLPFNEAAFSADEVLAFLAEIEPERAHLLGRVKPSRDVAAAAAELGIATGLSADANRLRALLGARGELTPAIAARAAAEADAFMDAHDTDVIGDFYSVHAWVQPGEAERLAMLAGVVDPAERRRWREAAVGRKPDPWQLSLLEHDTRPALARLLEEAVHGNEFHACLLLERWWRREHLRSCTPRARSEAITAAFSADSCDARGCGARRHA